MRFIQYIVCLMPMIVVASPYVLNGLWIMQKGISFKISKDLVTSISEYGSEVSMRLRKYTEEDDFTIRLELEQLEIIHKPVDWYNAAKYMKHIRYLKKIRKHGISTEIFFTSLKKDQVLVKATIGDEHITPFLLERKS